MAVATFMLTAVITVYVMRRGPVVTRAWRILAGLLAGLVFGFGLSVSGMVDPSRVRAFLDVTGDWNASLAFVLAGAVAVSALGQAVAQRMRAPLFDTRFAWPRIWPIDRRLVAGSAIFGVGWGLSGLCPGPAIASLALGLLPSVPATVTPDSVPPLDKNLPPPRLSVLPCSVLPARVSDPAVITNTPMVRRRRRI